MQTPKTSSFAIYKSDSFWRFQVARIPQLLLPGQTHLCLHTGLTTTHSLEGHTRNSFAQPAPWSMNKASASVWQKQNSPVQVCSRCRILFQFLRITHHYFHHYALSYNNLLRGKNPKNNKKTKTPTNNNSFWKMTKKTKIATERRPEKLLRNSS